MDWRSIRATKAYLHDSRPSNPQFARFSLLCIFNVFDNQTRLEVREEWADSANFPYNIFDRKTVARGRSLCKPVPYEIVTSCLITARIDEMRAVLPCARHTSTPSDFIRPCRPFTNGAPSGAAPDIMNLSVFRLYFATSDMPFWVSDER